MKFARFWARPRPSLDGDPRVPDGRRLYAIGDVHGRDDLLRDLLGQIEADNAARPAATTTVVFLGDLIDRGPGSREVIERVIDYRPAGISSVYLAGNHEDVFCRILAGDHGLIANWLQFGGAACAQSYGLDPDRLRGLPAPRAAAEIRASVPRAHRTFLEDLDDSLRAGDYLFVHAGIRPHVPLSEQRAEDLRWIRRPFLDFDGRHEAFVVHGHTISEDIDEAAGRIGIDTGAYASGTLTALGLEGVERWVLQTRPPAGPGDPV